MLPNFAKKVNENLSLELLTQQIDELFEFILFEFCALGFAQVAVYLVEKLTLVLTFHFWELIHNRVGGFIELVLEKLRFQLPLSIQVKQLRLKNVEK